MRQLKFVIWGAGFRGIELLKLLSLERVVAFIDNDNEKIGSRIGGVPVISFELYCKQFREHFIIISVADYEEIESFLKQKNIAQYFILSECPSELQGYGTKTLEKLFNWSVDDAENIVIVGSNLYSVLLYEYFLLKGYSNVICYVNEERSPSIINSMRILLNLNVINNINDLIGITGRAFITTREIKNIHRLETLDLKLVKAFDFSYKIKEYYNEKIVQFKNIHEGKRCFIVATGPSLKVSDLNLLYKNREICFGVNRIFNVIGIEWKPDYYMAIDNNVIRKNINSIINYDVGIKFLNSASIEYPDEKYKNVYKTHVVTDDIFDIIPDFSEDASRVLYGGATVTYACIQMAVYMGFKEIVLLGVDCNYMMGSRDNYFFKAKEEDRINHREDRMLMSYEAAKKYADAHNIKILNATRGGKLEVFERVDFDSLFYV